MKRDKNTPPEDPVKESRRYVENARKTLTMSHPHPDIVDYKNAVRLRDRKLLGLVTDGYITMHINMGYDGIQSKNACDDGFRLAEAIIERCAAMIPVVPAA